MPTTYTTDPAARREIEKRILDMHREGAERISVRTVMQEVRDELQTQVNNNDQTAITDHLLATYPLLASKIHTRARGQRGLNRAKQGQQLARLLRSGAVIDSLIVTHKGQQIRLSARQLALLVP